MNSFAELRIKIIESDLISHLSWLSLCLILYIWKIIITIIIVWIMFEPGCSICRFSHFSDPRVF